MTGPKMPTESEKHTACIHSLGTHSHRVPCNHKHRYILIEDTNTLAQTQKERATKEMEQKEVIASNTVNPLNIIVSSGWTLWLALTI